MRSIAQRKNVGRSVTFELVRLVVCGAVPVAVMLVFAISFLVCQGMWTRLLEEKAKAFKPVNNYGAFLSAIAAESTAQIKGPDRAREKRLEVEQQTNDALDAFSRDLGKAEVPVDVLLKHFELYRSAVDTGTTLQAHLNLVSTAAGCVFAVFRHTLASHCSRTLDTHILLSMKVTYASLASRLLYLHAAKQKGDTVSDVEAISVSKQIYRMNLMGHLSDSVAMQLGDYVLPAMLTSTELATKAFGFTEPASTDTVTTPPTSSLEAMNNYLISRVVLKSASTEESVRSLYLFVIGNVLLIVALVLVIVVIVKHVKAISTAVVMLRAFESEENRARLQKRYLPLLLELRASSLPSKPRDVIEREYLIVARFLEMIRVTVPQLLFGECQASPAGAKNGNNNPGDQTEKEKKPWSITEQQVRLSQSTVYPSAGVVLDIELAGGNDPLRRPNVVSLPVHLEYLCDAYHIIVDEINRAAGVVLGFRNGLHVMAAWNVTNEISNAALVAVRTAWIIRHRLMGLVGATHVYMSIMSGPIVLSVRTLGSRRLPLLSASFFSDMEKLRLLARLGFSQLLIDSNVYQMLPRSVRLHCKPVVVLTSDVVGCSRLVVFSADEAAQMNSRQASIYYNSFALYQQNIMGEAVKEFERYLMVYPDDTIARWLYDTVLLPKRALDHKAQ